MPAEEREELAQARDALVASAPEGAAERLHERIDAAIERLAARGAEFTAEDVRRLADEPPVSEVGARLRLAAARAVVRKVGYRKARRGPTHAHPPSVWRGTAAFVAECARGEGEPSPA